MILTGESVSPGIAFGHLFLYHPAEIDITEGFCESSQVEAEIIRLELVKEAAIREIQVIAHNFKKTPPRRPRFSMLTRISSMISP